MTECYIEIQGRHDLDPQYTRFKSGLPRKGDVVLHDGKWMEVVVVAHKPLKLAHVVLAPIPEKKGKK